MLKKGTKIMLISQGDRPVGGLIRRNYDSLHCKILIQACTINEGPMVYWGPNSGCGKI
jgi:hypothetical protein